VSQLQEAVATDIYNWFAYENPGLRPREILGKTYLEMADVLFSRVGFFRDPHQLYGVKLSPLKFKKMIVERMQREETDAWVIVEKLLSDGLRIT
jgi:hypothetical protein